MGDYKLLSKVDIERIFSKEGHSLSREVPRIFIFDVCDGDGEHGKFGTKKTNEENLADLVGAADAIAPEEGDEKEESEEEEKDAGKDVDWYEKKEEPTPSPEALWARDTEHPDYQMAELNGSTRGFQSKLNRESGSYLIAGFVSRAEKAFAEKGFVPRIGPIFKDIQLELGKVLKKQQPSYIWNNDTSNVQLHKRCDDEKDGAQNQGKTTMAMSTAVVFDDGNALELTTTNARRPEMEMVISRSQSVGEGKGAHTVQSSMRL